MDQDVDLWGDPIPPRPEKRGRPAHDATPEKRNRVKVLRALNQTNDEIAAAMGISERTLRTHYLPELRGGRAQLRAEALVKLYTLGHAGNVAALKAFIAETRHADLTPTLPTARATPRPGKKEQADLDATQPDGTSAMGALLAEREGRRLN